MSNAHDEGLMFSPEEKNIFSAICRSDGLKARELAHLLGLERSTVNHLLYSSPLLQELSWKDREDFWHGLIRQQFPHPGLFEFCGFYSTVRDFLVLSEEEWLRKLEDGCRNIGRSLSDARGLLHSFRDERETMLALFRDLADLGCPDFDAWELAFEFRIKRSRYIRIYADVLLITPRQVFSLEFKMKNEILPEELQQALKYASYLDLIFGRDYDVVPVLVLTAASELFRIHDVPGRDGAVLVCSGDMLYNAPDRFLHFLK